jgi:SAM-dependent methyltransferase
MENPYDENFFESHRAGSLESARQIVPYIMELVGCRSVVDVGCGSGDWLSAFRENGVTDIRGIDGSYVNQDKLAIPKECFVTADLRMPPKADRSFDLAMSVEVAEHLPASASESFVDLLTAFSPVVLFSASLPYQDGTQHINEQWLEYWIGLFQKRLYRAIDCVRPKFWNNPQVEWWYCQNAVLYISERHLSNYPRAEALLAAFPPPVTWVHPKFLMHKEGLLQKLPPLREAWETTLKRSWTAVVSRFRA